MQRSRRDGHANERRSQRAEHGGDVEHGGHRGPDIDEREITEGCRRTREPRDTRRAGPESKDLPADAERVEGGTEQHRGHDRSRDHLGGPT